MGSFNTLNKIRCNFSVIPNALIEDCSLSDRARFLFVFMASKPDNWQFYREPLANELGYSLNTLNKYLKELVDSGWIIKIKQNTNPDGTFGCSLYELLDSPSVTQNLVDGPCTKNTVTVKNRDGKIGTLYNKDILNNKNNINNKECEYSACVRNDQMWMESLAMRSKTGRLLFDEWENISKEFIAHITGVDELTTIQTESDFKRRFYYWFLKEREKSSAKKEKENGNNQAKERLAQRVREASGY